MFQKKIKLVLTLLILYQTPLYSKSNSFDDLDSKTLSNYFSGIVAFENKDNSLALDGDEFLGLGLDNDNEEELSPLSRSPMSQSVYFVDLDDEEEEDTKAKNKEPVEA